MSGGTESNGTGVGELPSLVLGIATVYHIFFDLELVQILVNFLHLCLVNLHLLFLFSYAGVY